MTDEIFADLREQKDVRQNLIKLRQMIKDDADGSIRAGIDGGRKDILVDLLSDDDAKTRRNAALILGELGDDSMLGILMYAYTHEEKLFIRSDYLTAVGRLDYKPVLGELEERLKAIENTQLNEENRKHLAAEAKQLRDLILKARPPAKHKFTGFSRLSDMILVVSPGMEQLTADEIPEDCCEDIKSGSGAVFVRTDRPGEIMKIRTVKSFLFRFCANPLKSGDPEKMADEMADAGLAEYIIRRHSGQPPFYFRIDMHTRLVLNDKSRFIAKLSSRLEERSGYTLQNSASDYEISIRISQDRSGRYSAYLELEDIPDLRFAYRKYSVATSTNPVRAAEIAAVAGVYMAPNAAVLDPFCGTAALLIERGKKRRAKFMYGVDIYGEAVRLAQKNAERAGMDIFFINKDCLEFSHRYMFDEVITELPAVTERMTRKDLSELCYGFVRRLHEWTATGGRVIVCTSEPEILLAAVRRSRYLRLDESRQLSGKRGDTVIICTVL